jgi:hypothetical protein
MIIKIFGVTVFCICFVYWFCGFDFLPTESKSGGMVSTIFIYRSFPLEKSKCCCPE